MSDQRTILRVHAPVVTIVAKGDAPWQSLKDLVEYIWNNPGIEYGNLGKNTT